LFSFTPVSGKPFPKIGFSFVVKQGIIFTVRKEKERQKKHASKFKVYCGTDL